MSLIDIINSTRDRVGVQEKIPPAQRVFLQSVYATLLDPEGLGYLLGICTKISYKAESGSYCHQSPEDIWLILMTANWEIESVQEGERPSVLLTAKCPHAYGSLGIRCLADMDERAELVAGKFHGEKVQLGWGAPDGLAGRTSTDTLHAVCGVNDKGDGTLLITAFPGPNVPPEKMEVPEEYNGKIITVKEARALGAEWCKIVTSKAAQAALERR